MSYYSSFYSVNYICYNILRFFDYYSNIIRMKYEPKMCIISTWNEMKIFYSKCFPFKIFESERILTLDYILSFWVLYHFSCISTTESLMIPHPHHIYNKTFYQLENIFKIVYLGQNRHKYYSYEGVVFILIWMEIRLKKSILEFQWKWHKDCEYVYVN